MTGEICYDHHILKQYITAIPSDAIIYLIDIGLRCGGKQGDMNSKSRHKKGINKSSSETVKAEQVENNIVRDKFKIEDAALQVSATGIQVSVK